MALNSEYLNAVASGGASAALYASVGDNIEEKTTRYAINWAAPVDGNIEGDPIDMSVPEDTTISHIYYWSAETLGTFYGDEPLPHSETFVGPNGVARVTPKINHNAASA